MANNSNIFHPANKAIVEDIKTELRLQGHYFTGALEASLISREVSESGGITLTAEALQYLEDLEKGIAANQIDDSKINIQALANWVRIKSEWRGCSEKASIKIALTIIKRWKKEGFELEGALKFSKTGTVENAVEQTFEKNQPKYIEMIDDVALSSLDNLFTSVKSGTI